MSSDDLDRLKGPSLPPQEEFPAELNPPDLCRARVREAELAFSLGEISEERYRKIIDRGGKVTYEDSENSKPSGDATTLQKGHFLAGG